jgi:hypothetical protein
MTRRTLIVVFALLVLAAGAGVGLLATLTGHPAASAYHTSRTVPHLTYVWHAGPGQITTSPTVPVLSSNWGPSSEARP